MNEILWLVAIVAFGVLEALSSQMISIWFAGGAVAGLLVSLTGASFSVQMYSFIGVTIVLLLCTRPLVRRLKLKQSESRTNTDLLIGARGIVTEDIDNIRGTGEVKVSGLCWTARTDDDSAPAAGSVVQVERIEGVKLIVKADGE